MQQLNFKKNKFFIFSHTTTAKKIFSIAKRTTTGNIIVALPLMIGLLLSQSPCVAEASIDEPEALKLKKTINNRKKSLIDTKNAPTSNNTIKGVLATAKQKKNNLDATDETDKDDSDEEINNPSPATAPAAQKNKVEAKDGKALIKDAPKAAAVKFKKRAKKEKKINWDEEDTGELEFYGSINRALLSVDDGHRRHSYFVDNDHSNSNIGFKGTKELKKDLTFGGKLEMLMAPVSSSYISQLDRVGNERIDINEADVWIENKDEKLSLGYGNMASADGSTANLSGTELIMGSDPSYFGGSMIFHHAGTGEVSQAFHYPDPISVYYIATPSLSMYNRVRYDVTRIKNFKFSTSFGASDNADENNVADPAYKNYYKDIAVSYEKSTKKFTINANASLARSSKNGNFRSDQYSNTSFAILHKETGLNAAVAVNQYAWLSENEELPQDGESYYKKQKSYYLLLGKQQNIFKSGKTNFAIDYYTSKHIMMDYDKGASYGAGIVQDFDKYKTNLYFGVRKYKYTNIHESYDNILVAFLGIKINFNAAITKPKDNVAGGVGRAAGSYTRSNNTDSSSTQSTSDSDDRGSVKRAVVRRR